MPKTVLLEFEWVSRGFYGQTRADIVRVLDHLMALPMMQIEDESVVSAAVSANRADLDFADALHHASAHTCERFLTFDDRGFARPATRMTLKPTVGLPSSYGKRKLLVPGVSSSHTPAG